MFRRERGREGRREGGREVGREGKKLYVCIFVCDDFVSRRRREGKKYTRTRAANEKRRDVEKQRKSAREKEKGDGKWVTVRLCVSACRLFSLHGNIVRTLIATRRKENKENLEVPQRIEEARGSAKEKEDDYTDSPSAMRTFFGVMWMNHLLFLAGWWCIFLLCFEREMQSWRKRKRPKGNCEALIVYSLDQI